MLAWKKVISHNWPHWFPKRSACPLVGVVKLLQGYSTADEFKVKHFSFEADLRPAGVNVSVNSRSVMVNSLR